MGWKPAQAWTSRQSVEGYRHFRLVLQGGKGKDRWVELEAVLDASLRQRFPWQQLRDPEQWTSGWQQIPTEDSSQLTEGSAMNSEGADSPRP